MLSCYPVNCSCPVYLLFFNLTSPTAIYPLSLHDALPIYGAPQDTGRHRPQERSDDRRGADGAARTVAVDCADRKSTRLNSSHVSISYAVFCWRKKTIAR